MSGDKERQREAVETLYAAAEIVVSRHDSGTLSIVKGDSMAIEALRQALMEAHFAKVTEAKR